MNIIKIENASKAELNKYSGLSEPQLYHYYEPEPGLFIAESPMIIKRAIAAGYEPESLLAEEKMLPELAGIKEFSDIPVYTAPLEILTDITGYMFTRGVLCAMRRKPLPDLDSVLNRALRIAVLENVMNPTNLGAVFRSAAALGMDAVLLSGGCTDPLYRRAARVSMGTVFQIPWLFLNDQKNNCAEGVRALKEKGYTAIAMALQDDAADLKDLHPGKSERMAVVLGTEGPGLAEETVSVCDHKIMIPMSRGIDSLNVAAASAVVFWHINNN